MNNKIIEIIKGMNFESTILHNDLQCIITKSQ